MWSSPAPAPKCRTPLGALRAERRAVGQPDCSAAAAAAEAAVSAAVADPRSFEATLTVPAIVDTGPFMETDLEETPLIQMVSLWKNYGMGASTVHALQDVDLTITAGEYVAIMGQSGSGKSTLMHILGCLDVPSSGCYFLDGHNVQDLDDAALAAIRNRRIGFVFQQFHLLARLSARRNVELPLGYAGVTSRNERMDRARRALDAVGLSDRADHRPGELSGGQQQRVAIARALVTEPAIILADEPTGNLAGDQSAEILSMLDGLWAGGRTVILITHDPGVAAHARRRVRVRDGRVISEDSAG